MVEVSGRGKIASGRATAGTRHWRRQLLTALTVQRATLDWQAYQLLARIEENMSESKHRRPHPPDDDQSQYGLCTTCSRRDPGQPKCTAFFGTVTGSKTLCKNDFCRHPANVHTG